MFDGNLEVGNDTIILSDDEKSQIRKIVKEMEKPMHRETSKKMQQTDTWMSTMEMKNFNHLQKLGSGRKNKFPKGANHNHNSKRQKH